MKRKLVNVMISGIAIMTLSSFTTLPSSNVNRWKMATIEESTESKENKESEEGKETEESEETKESEDSKESFDSMESVDSMESEEAMESEIKIKTVEEYFETLKQDKDIENIENGDENAEEQVIPNAYILWQDRSLEANENSDKLNNEKLYIIGEDGELLTSLDWHEFVDNVNKEVPDYMKSDVLHFRDSNLLGVSDGVMYLAFIKEGEQKYLTMVMAMDLKTLEFKELWQSETEGLLEACVRNGKLYLSIYRKDFSTDLKEHVFAKEKDAFQFTEEVYDISEYLGLKNGMPQSMSTEQFLSLDNRSYDYSSILSSLEEAGYVVEYEDGQIHIDSGNGNGLTLKGIKDSVYVEDYDKDYIIFDTEGKGNGIAYFDLNSQKDGTIFEFNPEDPYQEFHYCGYRDGKVYYIKNTSNEYDLQKDVSLYQFDIASGINRLMYRTEAAPVRNHIADIDGFRIIGDYIYFRKTEGKDYKWVRINAKGTSFRVEDTGMVAGEWKIAEFGTLESDYQFRICDQCSEILEQDYYETFVLDSQYSAFAEKINQQIAWNVMIPLLDPENVLEKRTNKEADETGERDDEVKSEDTLELDDEVEHLHDGVVKTFNHIVNVEVKDEHYLVVDYNRCEQTPQKENVINIQLVYDLNTGENVELGSAEKAEEDTLYMLEHYHDNERLEDEKIYIVDRNGNSRYVIDRDKILEAIDDPKYNIENPCFAGAAGDMIFVYDSEKDDSTVLAVNINTNEVEDLMVGAKILAARTYGDSLYLRVEGPDSDGVRSVREIRYVKENGSFVGYSTDLAQVDESLCREFKVSPKMFSFWHGSSKWNSWKTDYYIDSTIKAIDDLKYGYTLTSTKAISGKGLFGTEDSIVSLKDLFEYPQYEVLGYDEKYIIYYGYTKKGEEDVTDLCYYDIENKENVRIDDSKWDEGMDLAVLAYHDGKLYLAADPNQIENVLYDYTVIYQYDIKTEEIHMLYYLPEEPGTAIEAGWEGFRFIGDQIYFEMVNDKNVCWAKIDFSTGEATVYLTDYVVGKIKNFAYGTVKAKQKDAVCDTCKEIFGHSYVEYFVLEEKYSEHAKEINEQLAEKLQPDIQEADEKFCPKKDGEGHQLQAYVHDWYVEDVRVLDEKYLYVQMYEIYNDSVRSKFETDTLFYVYSLETGEEIALDGDLGKTDEEIIKAIESAVNKDKTETNKKGLD